MRIHRLELKGFKSFPDRTAIDFPPGLSAVVGPNGCGKSNIVDAIRWVLGEQSARQLRGRTMEDIIFSGAMTQNQLGMAEVSMFLRNDNGNGATPASLKHFSEVMITRRLYRSGESEYLINNSPCRLKDLHNLFFDSGLGNKNYTVIEQGKINVIVDMRPDERRFLLEEAAGISKYKSRKKESLRKLEQAQLNLTRIRDIMDEVKRRLGSLKRQAAKARRYQKLKKELRQLELAKASYHYLRLRDEIKRLAEEYARQSREAEDSKFELEALRARLESEQLSYQESEDLIKERYDALYSLQEDIGAKEREAERVTSRLGELNRRESTCSDELASAKVALMKLEDEAREHSSRREAALNSYNEKMKGLEQAEAALKAKTDEAREAGELVEESKRLLFNLIAKQTELKNTLSNLDGYEQELSRRNRSLAREKDEISSSAEETEYELSSVRSQYEELEEQESQLKGELSNLFALGDSLRGELKNLEARKRIKVTDLHALEGRLSSLRELWERRQWLGEGARAFIKAAQDKTAPITGVQGVVADAIRIEPQYELALEAALGPKLEAVIMRDQQSALDAMALVGPKSGGRYSLLCADLMQSARETRSLNGAPLLSGKVKCLDPHAGLAAYLLGDFLVAENMGQAQDLWRRYSAPVALVDGTILDAIGVIHGGSDGKKSSRILSKLREIEDLEAGSVRLKSELDDIENEIDQIKFKQDELEGRLNDLKDRRAFISEELSEIRQTEFRLEERTRHLQSRAALIEKEISQLEKEAAGVRDKRERAAAEAASVARNKQDAELRLEEMSAQARALQAELEQEKELLYGERLEANKFKEILSHVEREIERLNDYIREGRERAESFTAQLQAIREEREGLFEREEKLRDMLAESSERLSGLKSEITGLQEKQDAKQEEINAISSAVKQKDNVTQQLKDNLSQTSLKLKEVELNFEHIKNESRSQHGVELEGVAEKLSEYELNIEEADGQIEQLKTSIEGLGEVNPMAIQEYDALSERDEFLQKQHDDLVESIEDIHSAIRKINKTCKQKFLETFELVNANLKEVFPVLFNGGKAELIMTNKDQPLDSGIEITVHPPGKKLTTMGLLSGGEKALTALALLFSMYLIKPSPFCLLDEIDAPLDEANIDRFNQLLRRMSKDSQIILITHNRRTMEIVDRLFGVTMERPGVSKLISVNLEEATAA